MSTATSILQVSSFCIEVDNFRNVLIFIWNKMIAYSKRAPNTKKMQTNIQAAIAVIPSTLGEFDVTMLKMLISTRKRVMSMAILPGTTSGGMRNPTHETTTKRPEGR